MSIEKKTFKKWFKDNENKWISFGIITICLAILMPTTIFFASDSRLTADSFSKLGTVGDFLGGSTVGLLSLASIFFIISTIVMQRKELELQRTELQLTRVELAKSNEQYEITNHTMKLQQFETTFFNMIQMHNNLINDLKLFGEEYRGREVIVMFYEDILNYYKKESLESYFQRLLIRNRESLEELADEYAAFYNSLKNVGNRHFSQGTFLFDAEQFVFGNSYDELMQPIKPITIFKITFDELKANVDMSMVDYQFSIRIRDEFFNNMDFKETAFNIVNDQKKYPLSNYIKSVKTIIRLVDQSNFDFNSKNKYLNIFFSQFTLHEITIINYFIKLSEENELKAYFAKYDSLNTKEKLQDSII
ncbi:putative phage abortive infection protein [Lysinibacillus sp. NPDC097287]|uniref:putative phage abortive infection protein n=1 Tax=Lysinibacillus sp. NPDC097287 TaxID=3364144 RepID=UPI00380109E3